MTRMANTWQPNRLAKQLHIIAKKLELRHITSTAYGTPAVEWAVGEAAGIVAAYCAGVKTYTDVFARSPQDVRHLQEWLARKRRVPIYWYDDEVSGDNDFVRAQMKPFREPGYNESSTTLHYRD